MILKGSQRANGADLAVHLMNSFDNESVEIAEVYGTVAGDLFGAFAEFEAVASGTKAKQYLYSLSISPPSPLTRAQYLDAIGTIEHRLGLQGQPRAVVFHVKEGREHCHVVWSRIDIERMQAIHMAHDRRKLMDCACELAHRFGLELPPGLKAWQEKQRHEKEKLEPNLAERAQEQATGISPEQRRTEITEAFAHSDSAESFRAALLQKGYVLARGDRRGFVVVDRHEGVHSLSRYVEGQTAKTIARRLAPLTPADLPSVEQAKEYVRSHLQRRGESGGEGDSAVDPEQERGRLEALRKRAEARLVRVQHERRVEVAKAEQALLSRQQHEKLMLHAAQKSDEGRLLFRVRSAVADLIAMTPGLRSVLGPLQTMTQLDPRERQAKERDALARRHEREKLEIERRKRALARAETRERRSLEKALKRKARMAQAQDVAAAFAAAARMRDEAAPQAPVVRAAFKEAAGKSQRQEGWIPDEGELRAEFNDAADLAAGSDASGDDEQAPGWKQRAGHSLLGQRPRRSRGRRR